MPDDKQLKQRVLAALAWEHGVAEAHIGVTVVAGVVTLSGHVTNFIERHLAESATGRVKGVKGIAEEIEVRLPFDNRRGDEEIAAAALGRLAWDASIPNSVIKVKVESGLLTLFGEVDSYHQRKAAGQDVRGLQGVTDISNQITIKPRFDASELRDHILNALHRSWLYDSANISVIERDGKIKLSGTVQSWPDRQVAAEIAWSAPGAIAVENDISIA